MKRIIIVFFLVLFSPIEAERLDELISAEYAILMDSETGDIFFEKNPYARCAPSSMTKLLTAYILFSEISQGHLKLTDEFPVSLKAQKMKGSRSFFQAGTTVKIEDLIRSIIVHSGNDACVIVAEGISGDVDVFAEKMNETAQKLGLKNSHFTNPHGLPDEDHFSCVGDIAMISKRIISDFPQFYRYFSEKVFTINSITQQNRNTLLGNSLKIDGLKTGRTNAGGYGISVSASNSNGKRLIAVVNGCKTSKNRAHDANKLLAFGFQEFVPIKIAKAGNRLTEAYVDNGVKNTVGLCSHADIIVSVPRKYRDTLTVEAKMKEPLIAPIALGKKLGELIYKYGSFTSKPHYIFACESVEEANVFQKIKFFFQRFFSKKSSQSQESSGIVRSIAVE
ncbi:MAG: D-alanyl-D-alanine carboxypeptidase [Holosporaceae bacterium]|jgi:D-alanyl-D-alanine carboxypeptidase (penicillin-binding protein 5/6)|nr:D-alanyl-D-alanine carboxypeptidase [Holosporaceae bacterium]